MSQEQEKNRIERGTLYLVSTPIGNLADLSERAVKVLSEVDFIAAEDTRNTGKLLSILGISKPMISYFEHNKQARAPKLLARLKAGEAGALVTDAGTPAVSDPGEDLVRLCAEEGITVTSVPGPCAAIAALTLSALPTAAFSFVGFLKGTKREQSELLASYAARPDTLIFYEAPHRLRTTLALLLSVLGDRRVALCRELTKRNEEIERTTLSEAIARYAEKEPRGEYVLVVAAETPKEAKDAPPPPKEALLSVYERYLAEGMTTTDAVKAAAKETGMVKRDAYRIITQEKDARGE